MKAKLLTFLKIIIFLLITISGIIVFQETLKGIENKSLHLLIRESGSFVIAFAVFAMFIIFIDRKKLNESVLFIKKGKLRYFLIGTAVGVLMIIVTTFILTSGGWIKLTLLPENQKIWPVFIIASLTTMLFTAFWEELVFRGFVLKNLREIIGPHPASILVACIFGLLHLLSPLKSVTIVISTIFSGLLLNYAFLKTNNLYFPTGIHFLWNALVRIIFGGTIFNVEINNELMGGLHNPEQGLVAIIVTGIAFLIVLLISGHLKPADY